MPSIKPTIFLGIDPGTTIIGYGVVDMSGNNPVCVEYGIISNPGKDSSADKLATLRALKELINKHRPDMAGVEKLFFFKNQKTVMAVSEMRGVIMLALQETGLPVKEFTPPQIKQRICGHGQADKKQVQKMVRMLLRLRDEVKPDDAADALAIALCCATSLE